VAAKTQPGDLLGDEEKESAHQLLQVVRGPASRAKPAS
jgi:hypothetical protein